MEENDRCINCRWIYGGELHCVCPASDYRGLDVSGEDTSDCDQFHHWDCLENMNEDNGGLFDE